MVGMVLVLIAVVVIAVGAVLVFLRLRPRGGDLDSVRSYHSALGTLEHLGQQAGPSGVRVVGPAERPAEESRVRPRRDVPAAGGLPPVPPVPVRGSDEFPDPGTPLVFDDARPADRVQSRTAPEGGAGPARVDRAQRHALDSMNRRPRRVTTIAAAVVLLALVAGLAYSGSRHPHHAASATTSPPASTPGTVGTHPARSTSPSTSAPPRHTHGAPSGHRHTRTTTATTAPSRIVAVSTTGASATYQVASATYQLSLSATEECWVLARSSATGATLWTGTLSAGANQLIPATGAVTLELGAPGVTVAVDRVPVVFPTPFHTPFEATFEPAASASAPATTTPATTTPATTGAGATG